MPSEHAVTTAGTADPGNWLRNFSGVAVAALTPFHHDGSLALELIPAYVEHLLERGASALMVGGTTGEFIAMSEAERGEVIAAFTSANGGRVRAIAHIGHADPSASHRLAAVAADAGADALAGILPYFHPTSPDAVRATLTQLAQSQPQLPFLPYAHPATGNRLGADQFAVMLDEVPQVMGAKLSLPTFDEMRPYLEMTDRTTFFCGNDDVVEQFVGAGGRATVSGNAAVFCEVVSHFLTALIHQDDSEVQRLMPVINEIIGLTQSGAPDRLKALLRSRGVDVGHARVTTSAHALTPPAMSELLRDCLQPTS